MKRVAFFFACLSLGLALNPSDPARLAVGKGSLTKPLTFTGELQAVDSTSITTPNIPSKWNFVISFLAPEGSMVKTGDLLAAFDASELQLRRLELEKKREEARLKIAQTEAQQEIQRQDALLAAATANKVLRVAELFAQLDPSLIARSEVEKYRYDFDKAKVQLEKARERLENQRAAAHAELEVVRLDFEEADLELKRALSELERMQVYAEGPGLVIYADGNDGRKVQVGDLLFKGMAVIELPNMDRLKIQATSFDSEYRWLKLGQMAEVILDAAPDRVFKGQVTRLPEVAKPKGRDSTLNLFELDVLMLETDLNIMRPGMTARAKIRVDSEPGWIVPRKALRFDAAGGARVVTAEASPREIAVQILDADVCCALVEGDLAEDLPLSASLESVDPTADAKEDWIRVKREDLKFSVSASGVLKAARSFSVTPPSIPQTWQYKIVQMAPEGQQVKEGDLLMRLDPTEVLKRLQEEQANLKKADQEFEKTKATLDLQVKDLLLELEEARVDQEKKANKLSQARQFESNLKIREAELEAELATLRVEILEKKLASTHRRTELQLRIFDDTKNLHQERIRAAQQAIQLMTITAPSPGVVIYTPNWNNEKKQVGSQVQQHETVLSLPDLESLIIEGQVAEVDSNKISLGQPVIASLDALPERTFSGRIVELGNIYRRASYDRPVKVLPIKVQLDEIDVRRMRPDMVVRLELVVDRFENVLALPLSVIQVEEGQSFVWVKNGKALEKRQIRPGRNNGIVAVIESGLAEGEEVSSRASGGPAGG